MTREEIVQELSDIIKEPEIWLDQFNPNFGCKPSEIIGTERECLIHEMRLQIIHGFPS